METITNKPQVLEQEEFSQLKKIQETNQELINKFGHIEIQIQLLKSQKNSLLEELNQNKLNEINFVNNIKEKYGDINLNLNTGEYSKI